LPQDLSHATTAEGGMIVTDDEEVLGSISVSVPAKRSGGDFFEHELPRSVMNAARVIALNATYA
jgi:DNA-binding IclR family transcriptional regulator